MKITPSSSGGNREVPGLLKEYSRDLTAMAAKNILDPVIGREREINRGSSDTRPDVPKTILF